ncbi:MAG: hypothetical protein RIS76_1253 [Verrucomicrobiota bacterium]
MAPGRGTSPDPVRPSTRAADPDGRARIKCQVIGLDHRIAVRFEYEFHDAGGQWYRAYGNENWEFAANGLMQRRFASINDLPITEAERKFRWERPAASATSA